MADVRILLGFELKDIAIRIPHPTVLGRNRELRWCFWMSIFLLPWCPPRISSDSSMRIGSREACILRPRSQKVYFRRHAIRPMKWTSNIHCYDVEAERRMGCTLLFPTPWRQTNIWEQLNRQWHPLLVHFRNTIVSLLPMHMRNFC